MRRFGIVFTPEAELQLVELQRHISMAASPQIAARFTQAIVDHCEDLTTLPLRGVARDDLRPGLRLLSYRRRVTIAFTVTPDDVIVIGIYYRGRDYQTLLRKG